MPDTAPAVVFFDVDGTLTCPERNVGFAVRPTERVREAVRALAARGHVAAISTGRSVMGLDGLRDLPFSGFVTLAGAYVELNGEVVHERLIEGDVIERTIDEMRRVGMEALLEGTRGCAVVGSREDRALRAFSELPGIDEYVAAGLPLEFGKIDFTEKSLEALRKSEFLLSTYDVVKVEGKNYELSLPGSSKALGARALLDALPFVPSRTYALGDSGNDLPIMREADVAIAMGNAHDEVKAIADYVTDTVQEDGVATALEHFGLI